MTLRISLLLALLLPVFVRAQVPVESPDIYDALNGLLSQMEAWRQDTSSRSPAMADSSRLDFDQVFAGYEYELVEAAEDTIRLDAQLPIYLGVLTTELSFLISEDTTGKSEIRYIPTWVETDGAVVFDGSTFAGIEGADRLSPSFGRALSRRFHLYRTLGLPEAFRPRLSQIDIPVTLYFHGRDIDSLHYSSTSAWFRTLGRLASGMLVYAGPTKIGIEPQSIRLRFYIALVTEGGRGHHFMLVDEKFERDGDRVATTGMTVRFYPYVRVDNLLSLYGTYQERDQQDQVPVRIGGEQ